MFNPKWGAPPAGGDHNKGTAIEVASWVFTSIALITVILRLYGRLRLTHNPGWDDFWIVLSMIFNLTYTILIVVAVNAGNGRHLYYLNPSQTSTAIKWNSIAYIVGIMSFSVPKVGVVVLLMRLLNPSRMQQYIMYSLSYTCIVISVLSAVLLWQQCDPSAGLWNPALKPVCWSPSILVNYSIFGGAFSAFTDFYLAAYPCFVLSKLNMSLRKKTCPIAVLSLGFIAGGIAIYRCTRITTLYDRTDYAYATTDLHLWTSIEGSFIIIAANLPTLQPIFVVVINRSLVGCNNACSSEKQKGSAYKPSSIVVGGRSGMRPGDRRGPKDPFGFNTEDLVRDDDSVDSIIPPNRIQKTFGIRVEHESSDGYGQVSERDPVHEHTKPNSHGTYRNDFDAV
ncbi:hypothetical protein GJ744_007141 [Endocarpon pusillum]|uniref:Rhodopsin domain-containing protein n=1 Tax=Endocarpon pusillum TaxID=364733 RepID=A0A8H7ANA1_9EURO|nr:hypothetical protein GJ744_007141 [Endocarpon pusillum]